MSVIYLVVPLALLLVLVAVVAFAWAGRSGQFDDMETPGLRILHDDTPNPTSIARPAHGRFTTDQPQSDKQ